jgi:preprotein translocase subunit SecY
MVVLVTAFVVFVERGQRRITVNYARARAVARPYMNQSSPPAAEAQHVGRDPADLRIVMIMFPATASSWFGQFGQRCALAADHCQALAPNEPLHMCSMRC